MFFGVFLRESARTAAKSRTNLSTHSGKATKRRGRLAPNLAHIHCANSCGNGIRQTNYPSRHKGGTWGGGGLEGQQSKSIGQLSDWHQLWVTSADSSGNGHRLNASRPSIPPGGISGGGGLGCHKFKSSGKLSNGWTDWHQIWHTSADPSGNGYTPNKLPLETQGGHLGGGGVRHSKVLGSCQTCLTDWHFGSRLRIHLGMDIG